MIKLIRRVSGGYQGFTEDGNRALTPVVSTRAEAERRVRATRNRRGGGSRGSNLKMSSGSSNGRNRLR